MIGIEIALIAASLSVLAWIEGQNLVMLQVGLGVLNIAVHIFMLYLIVKTLGPILSLRDAAAQVSRGNLDVKLEQSGGDELRDLADSFNSMGQSLKESTRQLEVSRQKYQDMYDKAPDLYRSINADGTIVDCNETYLRVLGFERKEDVIGRSIFEHTAEQSLGDMQASFQEWKRTGKVTNRQLWMKKKDGSTFPHL